MARKGFLGAWLSRKNGDPTPEEMALARAESLMPLLQDVLMEQKKLLKKLEIQTSGQGLVEHRLKNQEASIAMVASDLASLKRLALGESGEHLWNKLAA